MGEPLADWPTVPARAAASIQYTSGTTSRPRPSCGPRRTACGRAGQGPRTGLTGPTSPQCTAAFFHTNALSYSLLSTLFAEGHVVLQPRFSASRFWPVAVEHGATWSALVSFCAGYGAEIVAGPSVPGLGQQRRSTGAWSGGWPALGWFGMTETVTTRSSDRWTRATETMVAARGMPSPSCTPTARRWSPGEVGDLRVRGMQGVSLFAGICTIPRRPLAAVDAGGWLRTGDRVRRDRAGP